MSKIIARKNVLFEKKNSVSYMAFAVFNAYKYGLTLVEKMTAGTVQRSTMGLNTKIEVSRSMIEIMRW